MKPNHSLAQLKRKAYLAYHQDGILDLCIGATILSIGLWRLTDIVLFGSMSWLSISIYYGLKRAITVPRFGYVVFDEAKRKTQISIGMALVILLVLATGGVLFFGRPDQLPPDLVTFIRKFHEFVMSGIGALTMLIFGLWLGIRRLAGYGFVMLLVLWTAIQTGWRGDLTILSIGSCILLIGAFLLVRFITRYPIQPSEAGNAV